MNARFRQKLVRPTSVRPLVERRTFIERLEQAVQHAQFIAVTAPAGWGKTTTLAQWAAQSSMPVLWYTLDVGDKDPRVFLDYVLQAVADFAPQSAGLSVQLATAPPEHLAALFQAAAAAIADVPQPFALVLDDFHMLTDRQPEHVPGIEHIFRFVQYLIAYAPNCRLLIMSRTLPALDGMARLIAQQRAVVFDYTTLRFDTADIQQLAGLSRDVLLPDQQAERLTEQFGGWVTGLVLWLDQASDTTNWQIDPAVDVGPVFSFFAEQLLSPLAPEIQQFLEETSVLDMLTPEWCDALREASDSAVLLDAVAQAGLFVANHNGYLSLHALFRDFLQQRLARDTERWRQMLGRAADLYRADDDIERAFSCYLTAEATDDAIALLRAAAPYMRQQSRHATLLSCYERLSAARASVLPADLLLSKAELLADLAQWDYAETALHLAQTIGTAPQQCAAKLIHAQVHCLQGDSQAARQMLDGIQVVHLSQRQLRDYYYTIGRVYVLQSNVAAAIVALEQAHALSDADEGDTTTLAKTCDLLGWAYTVQQDWTTATHYLQQADVCWQSTGNFGRRVTTLNNLGVAAQADGRFGQARAAFETGLQLSKQTGRVREEATVRCSVADLDIEEGQLENALKHVATAYTLAQRYALTDVVSLAAVSAWWIAALVGDTTEEITWEARLDGRSKTSQPLVHARALLARTLHLLRQPTLDINVLATLVQHIRQTDAQLNSVEHAYVLLLDARVAHVQHGWAAAAPRWEHFAEQANHVPEALLKRFAPYHRELIAAAAATSPLGRHLQATVLTIIKRWRVTAFGGFSCQRDDAACQTSALHRAVLLRLLDAGSSGLAVDRLWEDVWGDDLLSMPGINMVLSRLRSQTGLRLGVSEGTVAIQTPLDEIGYDVAMVESLLQTVLDGESVAQIFALYRGVFFPDAPISAALWADMRRASLQQRVLDALDRFADTLISHAPDQAMQWYQRILEHDRGREDTTAKLMQLAARFGRRSLVATTFNGLVRELDRLGARPLPTTVALYDQLCSFAHA